MDLISNVVKLLQYYTFSLSKLSSLVSVLQLTLGPGSCKLYFICNTVNCSCQKNLLNCMRCYLFLVHLSYRSYDQTNSSLSFHVSVYLYQRDSISLVIYNIMHLLCRRFCGSGLKTARTASSNTCFKPRCVRAEHSMYFTARICNS